MRVSLIRDIVAPLMRKLPPLTVVLLLAGCGSTLPVGARGKIVAIGAENEYANVISQVGGRYVFATAIEDNPNADPHAFEASPSVAQAIGQARLVVQNGLGYDAFMNRIESASPGSARRVIDVARLLGVPDSEPNPHLWYRPGTMAAVAGAVASQLAAIQPAHAAYFKARAAAFDRSLQPWYAALAAFRKQYPGTPVAVTEPVGDYMLHAAGARVLTPFTLQLEVMNGTDPAPQDIATQSDLLARRRVKVLLYNQQVTDTLTRTFLTAAADHGVPVVGVYETMPRGYTYQAWMLAEVGALRRAVAAHLSTREL
jgi:zinc/manganese transport system substrate-binding protein